MFLYILLLCILNRLKKKKFKATNSIKSQLHHPPHDNSCSAQKAPNEIDVIINKTILFT